ncbi:MAG: hypothetical protein KDD25_06925 [Bdellovibrionales bacterium]|nr:hypothetical protein [Bdellovibrionales bacterium]
MKKFFIYIVLATFGFSAMVGCADRAVQFAEKASRGGDDQPSDPGQGIEDPPPCPTCVPDPTIEDAHDVFFQVQPDGLVDILIVDDNSGSMEVEQERMGDKFNSFVSGLGDLNWQIGVTTTDVSGGPFNQDGAILKLAGRNDKILKKSTPNADRIFKDTVQRPETINCGPSNCPSGNEQPLYATIRSIDRRNSDNAGFFRNNADLAVVILSDEDEMSVGPSNATKAQDVIDKFKSVWGPEKKLFVYGIIIEPGDQNCLDLQLNQAGNTAHYGNIIDDLVGKTGGITGSICKNDYSDTLESIGENVRDLIDSVELAHVPIPGTVRVVLDPGQSSVRWNVVGNKIVFNPAPAAGTRMDIYYQYVK